jgi:hypothetical protein
MPSSYTTNVAIEKPADGEQVGNWGDTVNDNMDIVDRLTSQVGAIALTGSTYTLTTSTSGALSEGHYSVIKFTGTPGSTCVVTINPNTIERLYTIYNTSNQTVTMTQGSGGNVDIPAGKTKVVYSDGAGSGAEVVDVSAGLVGSTLNAIGDLAVADGNFIVGNGSTWVVESGNTVLGSLGVTSTAAELNILDGVTWSLTSYNTLTATAAELNTLDGITATVTELNYTDGVTSAIQTQLDAKEAADAEILKADTDDNLTAGYTATAADDGTKSSGTYTPAPAGGNLKRIVNGGAFTLAAPTASGDYTIIVQVTNNASAGAISTSGFSKTTGTGNLTTTDGDDFFAYITKINGFTSLLIEALQ